ncbi:50S ribosomal protein L1 [Erysipelotrichaceae bacterium Oil+RF-744-GAM-WT-6]|jgi:large subunit ribosomal protein L1|uniref:Large ribosomal subunit protein uL1 n=1 Tax=Stecheria intestinalis TaxID=2606630 RepID=A0A7X2TGE7_9FIRM|nr:MULTISPECIES: 50S ribosomal protein L1 [Erysipelotrichaceae]MCI2153974.1 50S ribosomal protein L1 [Solobacterium sp.]MDY3234470.1 50S ribosomal protein L1 [Erysipelotrichaceae bacterium]MDY4682379.1 50S ribosomal protein L1 [Lachnospiraceae bacterium]MCI6745818.1 50S ribosomal protein L1 [Anaerolactibacter massiliensis]MDD5880855.1 50S ribosomal protein L1 [Stecheria intestinalis]
MAGKKYKAAAAMIDSTKTYPYAEAVALAKKTSCTTFDSSVEASFSLNVDPKQADQNIRGAMVLPNGTGRSQRVLVITQGPKVEEAKNAGADYVGGQDMLDQIKNGWFDFDIIVATPDMMGQLGRLGKLLGPKGLMPNPKTGTVTMNVAQAIEEIKKGKVEYRVDKDGNVNVLIGKCSFSDEALAQNFKALYDQLTKVRPQTVKGIYMKGVTVSTTMGPGVKVTIE